MTKLAGLLQMMIVITKNGGSISALRLSLSRSKSDNGNLLFEDTDGNQQVSGSSR
jgi:hypothetical protein